MKNNALAQAVGLWLAEGDRHSRSEITLTNSRPELIHFFHGALSNVLAIQHSPRIYVYLPPGRRYFVKPIAGVRYRIYSHRHATRPFFIYRISGVQMTEKWKRIVSAALRRVPNYQGILQGFFAGEGNIKYIVSTRSRVLRVAQGKPFPIFENIMDHFGIRFHYEVRERAYVVSGRENLESLWRLDVATLHAPKRAKFHYMLSTYQQHHYARKFLENRVYQRLSRPVTSRSLAHDFERTQSRLQRVLRSLKEKNRIKNFRVRSTDYWIRTDSDCLVISEQKHQILSLLDKPRRLFELSKALGKDPKSVIRRLRELERFALVRKKDSYWQAMATKKSVIVL